jgi:hypothetical protein
VKEPVLVAVIGVGGVLVGAASSGLVQALLARAERKRDGRNAARVLSMELHDAEKAVSDLRELRDWTQMITEWDAYAETWAQYRNPLASVLNTSGFAKVAAAFGCLASLKRSHKRDTQNPSPQLAVRCTPRARPSTGVSRAAGGAVSAKRKSRPLIPPMSTSIAASSSRSPRNSRSGLARYGHTTEPARKNCSNRARMPASRASSAHSSSDRTRAHGSVILAATPREVLGEPLPHRPTTHLEEARQAHSRTPATSGQPVQPSISVPQTLPDRDVLSAPTPRLLPKRFHTAPRAGSEPDGRRPWLSPEIAYSSGFCGNGEGGIRTRDGV